MKLFFQFFMFLNVTIYRLSGGRIWGRMSGTDLLLLTTVGRKSGKRRTTPLMFVRDGESYVITASGGGSPKHPGWYWNAAKGTQPVQIQVKDQHFTVSVEDAQGERRDALYQRMIDANEGFRGYQDKVERTIPVLVLTPEA